jgi:hypothetical protein
MRKLFTTLLILSGIYTAAFAQVRNSNEFGIHFGFNDASVEYSGSGQSSDYTTGLNAGISLEHYFSDAWSIKGRLNYDQKGFGNGFVTFEDGTEIDGVNFHLNYLTIPVTANWHFGRMRNWYLNFGPYVGVLLNATAAGADVKDNFNTTDVGIALGIGIKIPVSRNMNFFVEADGQGGFTNIFTQSDGNYQNIRSSINFGFSFPLR